jgi:hypothetical protein
MRVLKGTHRTQQYLENSISNTQQAQFGLKGSGTVPEKTVLRSKWLFCEILRIE